MTHRDRAGNPPGHGAVGGKPRVLRDIVKAFRRPHRFARCRFACATGTAASQGLSGGVPHGLRCPASPRHALLAENLGKPSLWVIISAPWYKRDRTWR